MNEVDNGGDSALAIAERFGHKDGARHLFLFRWQVRAAQAEKVAEVPLYYHQQCDTANPTWLAGQQVMCNIYIRQPYMARRPTGNVSELHVHMLILQGLPGD